ncbi:unnamed protein product [Allacma fusca]|uniref:V-SNARE coiled-coil homology domain-containing protein n=1 Tax=Allacma fusca TaxID=39272 RepID=A0A8J2KEJ4_9HEXA|nr:unnamed protein product [Allacma fusca]
MRTNVEKVLERDSKLSELDDRADALQQGASQFEQQAGKLKRKYWWKNLKMMIIMGVIALILIIIIGVWISGGTGGSESSSGDTKATDAAPLTDSTKAPAGRVCVYHGQQVLVTTSFVYFADSSLVVVNLLLHCRCFLRDNRRNLPGIFVRPGRTFISGGKETNIPVRNSYIIDDIKNPKKLGGFYE